jgi:L-asparaginase
MKIQIFITGGTFDKEYDELKGKLFFKHTHLPEMIKLGRCRLPIDVKTLMMVDSIDMTEAQRRMIIDSSRRTRAKRIVITHGTDTMVETAKAISKVIKNKTIVLTGAMIPYKFGSSDGLFNLGSSLAFVQILPPGVYICMSGKYFPWNNVRKNKQTGQFEEIHAATDC